jgi:hypothetical protein
MDPYTGVIAWNDFDTGTHSLTVATGNSGGSGRTAFSGVQITGSSSVVYSAASPIHGLLSALVTGSGGFGMMRWDNAVVGNLTGPSCGVMHMRYLALPSAYSPIVEAKQTDGGALAFRVNVSPTGNFRLVNAAGSTVVSTTGAAITTDTTYRLEWQIDHSTGAYGVQLFAGDTTTPLDSLAGTSAAAFGTATQQVNFGRSASPDFTALIDTVAIDTAPLGPRVTTFDPVPFTGAVPLNRRRP